MIGLKQLQVFNIKIQCREFKNAYPYKTHNSKELPKKYLHKNLM